MPFSNNVSDYIPLLSIENATKKYQEYCDVSNALPSFLQNLCDRDIIQVRYFANEPYIQPKMFDDWLKKHNNKKGRPFQKEGYMDKIDVRKYLEETEKYSFIMSADIDVLFENNLLGKPLCFIRNTPYILKSDLENFYERDKLFCHSDIVNMVENYIKDTFEIVSINLPEIIGFDIEKTNSLIYRNYFKPIFFSNNQLNNSYFVDKKQVDKCMNKLKLLIQKNAKIRKQQIIEEGFKYRFTKALEHKAMIVNRLKPFTQISKKQKWKNKQKLKEKFNVIQEVKVFLSNEIENIDINTDFKLFFDKLRCKVPYDFNHNIYCDMSKLHLNKVKIPFEKEIEMYEDALLDEKKIFWSDRTIVRSPHILF